PSNLHSFPTRRSSDLVAERRSILLALCFDVLALGAQIVELYVESERKVEPSEPLWIAAQFQDQIGNHGKIDHQGDAFANAEVFDEFIDFEREQRSSRNDGEIFSPALAQCQANAVDEKNG